MFMFMHLISSHPQANPIPPKADPACSLRLRCAPIPPSINLAQQFRLQNELPFLVFLAVLIRLVVFPSYRLLALPAADVSNDMSASRHVALIGFAVDDIAHLAEEVGFAVLATEILVD